VIRTREPFGRGLKPRGFDRFPNDAYYEVKIKKGTTFPFHPSLATRRIEDFLPSMGLEPMAYALEGHRSIQLS
jgi:hypothetical protein